jgi:hypothetical protein
LPALSDRYSVLATGNRLLASGKYLNKGQKSTASCFAGSQKPVASGNKPAARNQKLPAMANILPPTTPLSHR